jgi:TolA-binding protein
MKKKYITSLILIGLMPFLTHCASQQDVQSLNYNVRSINKKLDDMKVNTVDQLQQRQAFSSGQVDQLQGDILKLKSQLEENAHMNRMLQEQYKELRQAVQNLSIQQDKKLASRLAEYDSRIARQKESLTAMQLARVQDAERRSKAAKKAANEAMLRAQQATVAKSTPKGSASIHLQPTSKKIHFSTKADPVNVVKAVAASPSTVTVQAVDTYAQGMQSYRNAKYKEAFGLFEKNISQKGFNKATISSRYMMGECLFKQGEYDQAIIQYQQIISNFPGNPEAAKALLRQGESFEKLSDNETARIIYKKITASYGSSPEAITARKRIPSL